MQTHLPHSYVAPHPLLLSFHPLSLHCLLHFFLKNPAHRPRRRRTPHPSDSLISSPSCCGVIISHHLQQCFGSGGSLLQSGSCDSPDLLLGDLFPAEADRINAKSPPGLNKLSLSFLFNPYNRWLKWSQFENGVTCVHLILTFGLLTEPTLFSFKKIQKQ